MMVWPYVFLMQTWLVTNLQKERSWKPCKRNMQVILCDSMPSIEFWFLIHYLNTNKYFASSTDVIKVLRRFLPDFSKHETYLAKEKWVVDMIANGKQDIAMDRAKGFGMTGESYSNIYKAFEKFMELNS